MTPSTELQAALDAAEQAAAIARSLFQHNIEVRIKADKSPVTEADVRCEIVLGVSSAPVYGELAFAERSCGAYLNGKPVNVSQFATLESAALSSGNMKTLA